MGKYSREQIDLIINGCKSGSESDRKKLYATFKNMVFSICYRYTKNKMEAEDIAQECFIKIFNKIGDYRGEGSFEGWIRRIAVNFSITEYNKRLKYCYHDDISQAYSIDDGSYEKIDFAMSSPELSKIIDGLPAGYKKVFKFYFIDGYNHKEIAKMMGVDITTSKSQLCRAKQMLRGRIEINNFI